MRVFTHALWFSVAALVACEADDHGLGVCGNAVPEADIGEECDDGEENADDGACTLACAALRPGPGARRGLPRSRARPRGSPRSRAPRG